MNSRDHHAPHGNGELKGRESSHGPIPDCDAPRRLRTGIDDGPPLPCQAARERAYAAIDAQRLVTDAERIDWLESVKYGQFGIGFDGHKYQVEVRVKQERYFGRSLRMAIDSAMGAG